METRRIVGGRDLLRKLLKSRRHAMKGTESAYGCSNVAALFVYG
jgi:hypothetical protein